MTSAKSLPRSSVKFFLYAPNISSDNQLWSQFGRTRDLRNASGSVIVINQTTKFHVRGRKTEESFISRTRNTFSVLQTAVEILRHTW